LEKEKESTMPQGTIKRYLDDRAFGFIRPDDGGPDMFVHIRNFPFGTVPEIGMRVAYDVANNPRSGRPEAVGVRVL
jgi:CspA family cold shock protein